MSAPETLTNGKSTECIYEAKEQASQAVLIRYDTGSSETSFARSAATFERRGFRLVRVTNLGDEAYYFNEKAGASTLTTIVVRSGSLQILSSGTGTPDQIGTVARYALMQFEAQPGQ